MRICAIISCNSRAGITEGVSFFRVPKKESDAVEWRRFIQAANYGAPYGDSKHGCICSLHFRECCIVRGSRSNLLVHNHYPSVIEGKVVANPKSKCSPISPEENLHPLSISASPSFTERRRAYLLKRLNSFSVPKIVLGSLPYKVPPQVMMTRRESAINSPEKLNKAITADDVKVEMEDNDTNDPSRGVIYEPIKNEIPTVSHAVEGDDDVDAKALSKVEKDSSVKRRKRKHRSPSSDMEWLKKENKLLRKSVSHLERRVVDISEEHKSLKNRMGNMEQQYHKLLSAFQNILKQNQQGSENQVSAFNSSSKECTCKPVEVVDICDDED